MASPGVDHLCVLIHGLWGNPPHLNYLRQTLLEHTPKNSLHILVAEHNADYNTYDGIEIGAERIAHEIEETVQKLATQGTKLTKISIIGYSLGGLIARYTVGILYKDGVFDNLQPVNFTTFASPWIGVRSSKKGVVGNVWNAIAPRTLSVSGSQMFCADKFRDTGRPLLAVLADPSSIFMRGLQRFQHKSLYANTMNDRSVPFYTAAFSRIDPFVDIDAVQPHYMDGQKTNAILDPSNPVSTKDPKRLSSAERFRIKTRRLRKTLPMYTLFTILFPIAVTFMLVNGAYQTYKSANRIRLHETGKTLVDSKRYRVALLEESQAIQDQALERLADVQTQAEEYLPTPPPEPANLDLRDSKTQQQLDLGAWSRLPLTEEQFRMIDNLEKLDIKRYWCHIKRARHTHAAIIVRYSNDDFAEGVEVVRHWAKAFVI